MLQQWNKWQWLTRQPKALTYLFNSRHRIRSLGVSYMKTLLLTQFCKISYIRRFQVFFIIFRVHDFSRSIHQMLNIYFHHQLLTTGYKWNKKRRTKRQCAANYIRYRQSDFILWFVWFLSGIYFLNKKKNKANESNQFNIFHFFCISATFQLLFQLIHINCVHFFFVLSSDFLFVRISINS